MFQECEKNPKKDISFFVINNIDKTVSGEKYF